VPVRPRRALILGAVIAAIDAYWVLHMEVVWNQGYASLLSLFFNVVCSLALLLVANAVLGRFRPGHQLTGQELLLIYIAASVATAVGMWVEYLMALLAYPYRHAAANGWTATILPHLPRWLTVGDADAVRDYFAGNAELYRWSSLRAWLLPIGAWSTCLLVLVGVTLCLCALARRQWTEHERLAYPITQIPLLMTQTGGAAFRTPLFWIGFVAAAGINVLNAAHMLYPTVPELVVKRHPWEWEGLQRPLSALNPVYVSWNPFLVGLEFFLPLDLLFSTWFFYAFARFQGVLFATIGIEQPGMAAESVAPYAREQAFGALVALLAFAFWAARHSWGDVVTRVRKGINDGEPIPPRVAAVGAGGGSLALLGFMIAAGMAPWLAVLFLLTYLAVIASLTRIRAQFGPPAAGLLLAAPTQVIVGALGTGALGATGLHGMALFHWLGREFAGHPMPHQLEAFRLASARGFPYRWAILAIVVGAVAGIATAFWGVLHLSYSLGQGTAKVAGTQNYFGREAYTLLAARLAATETGPKPDAMAAMLFGATLTLLLQATRTRFPGWPFHPVGYALSSTYVSSFLWSTAMLTWLFKLLLFRYAGLRGYRVMAPFFLGLVLGEFVVGSLIGLSGIMISTRMYVFWPY
jgi:hypothetical protein